MSDRLERLKHEVKTFKGIKREKGMEESKLHFHYCTCLCLYLSFMLLWGIYTNVADHKGTQRGRLSSYNKLLAYFWWSYTALAYIYIYCMSGPSLHLESTDASWKTSSSYSSAGIWLSWDSPCSSFLSPSPCVWSLSKSSITTFSSCTSVLSSKSVSSLPRAILTMLILCVAHS